MTGIGIEARLGVEVGLEATISIATSVLELASKPKPTTISTCIRQGSQGGHGGRLKNVRSRFDSESCHSGICCS
jgi:hypothetical protein